MIDDISQISLLIVPWKYVIRSVCKNDTHDRDSNPEPPDIGEKHFLYAGALRYEELVSRLGLILFLEVFYFIVFYCYRDYFSNQLIRLCNLTKATIGSCAFIAHARKIVKRRQDV